MRRCPHRRRGSGRLQRQTARFPSSIKGMMPGALGARAMLASWIDSWLGGLVWVAAVVKGGLLGGLADGGVSASGALASGRRGVEVGVAKKKPAAAFRQIRRAQALACCGVKAKLSRRPMWAYRCRRKRGGRFRIYCAFAKTIRRRSGIVNRRFAPRAYPLWVGCLPRPATPGKYQDNHHPIPREPPTDAMVSPYRRLSPPQPASNARHQAR